jgi:parallel beta-helix repeat protein
MPEEATDSLAANVWIDSSAAREGRSIAEIVITGCTIQHTAKSPAGANIRMLGFEGWPIDQVAIGNNIMSDASVNLHFDYVNSATVTGNTFFAPLPGDVLVTRSSRIVFSGNVLDPRALPRGTVGGVVFRDSSDCILSGNQFVDTREPKGALLLENCKRFSISGCSLRNCANGIVLNNAEDSIVSACLVSGTAAGGFDFAVEGGRGLKLANNAFAGETRVPPAGAAKE